MARIKINDIFDELIEENIEITECLNVLIKFKNFVDLISSKLKSNLGSNDLQMFDDLHKEVEEVFKKNKRDFSVHKNLIQKKTQNKILSSKPQTNDSNYFQLSFDSSKQLTTYSKANGFKSQSLSKTSNVEKRVNNEITERKDFTLDETQIFVCSFIGCGKRFQTRKSIAQHLNTHSNNPKRYVCDFDGCPFSTNRLSYLTDHINLHKGIKLYCDYCEKQFTSERCCKTHIERIHRVSDQILICELEECYKKFKTELSLKAHQRIHLREDRFVCTQPNCTFKTISATSLKIHISSVHSEDRPFICQKEGCSKAFKTNRDLSVHMETHTTELNFKCEFEGCGKAFKSKRIVRSHLNTHSNNPKRFVCDFDGCPFSTDRKSLLRDHINSHKGVKPYVCDYCEKQFTSDKCRKTHIDRIHEVSDQILICELEECYKKFKTELSLKAHQRIHLREDRFVCTQPNCTFKTISATSLKIHISTVHSDDRPFLCQKEGCSKAFKTNHLLDEHMLTHNSERNFKCEFEGCGKAFRTERTLKGHAIIHSDIKLSCDWPGCEYTTKHHACLSQHQFVHKTERNFPCNWPQCGKRFKRKPHLEEHIRIHKNDKRYACNWPGCQYRCTSSSNVGIHRKIHLKK